MENRISLQPSPSSLSSRKSESESESESECVRERGTKRKHEESGEGRDMLAQFGDGGMIFGACAENLPGEKFMLVVGKHCERPTMRAPG